MKRIANKIFNTLYSDIALYVYFSLSLVGILLISILQFQQNQIKVPSGVQPEFQAYVKNFLKESKKYVLPIEFDERMEHLTVKFGFPSRLDNEHDFVGWCDLNTTTIIIEKDTWNTYADGSKQSLIDHELGHCILERNHRHYLNEGNNPVSIMFPQVLPSEYYAKNKNALYPELFEYKRANKVRLEIQVLQLTWNQEIEEKFKNVSEYLRLIAAEINGDPYQPGTENKPKTQVVQLEPMVIVAEPKNNNRQGK